MACCAAIAIVLAGVRACWSWATGRGSVEDGFPPAASWSTDGPTIASARDVLGPAAGTAWGPALAATVLVYGLLIHLLSATGLAHVPLPGALGWFVRDAMLTAMMLGLLTLSRRAAHATVLVGAGALWFALGAVDMHVLGGFEFRAAPLALDAAFHLSGWWLMAAAAGVAVVQRRPAIASMGSDA